MTSALINSSHWVARLILELWSIHLRAMKHLRVSAMNYPEAIKHVISQPWSMHLKVRNIRE